MKKLSFLLAALLLAVTAAVTAAEVSLNSLLDEMLDRGAITEFPDPAYTCKQASSYDRTSKSPEEAGWFANGDASKFVRDEMNGDRKEWVLMDEKGPGAIVRWWITAPHYRSTFRIYIDGKEEPVITANIGELIGGDFLLGAPLSAERARSRNLYLPIPYEKSIKVTVDKMWTGNKNEEQGNLYYQINYRTYPEGTKVESFTKDNFKAQKSLIENEVSKELRSPPDYYFSGGPLVMGEDNTSWISSSSARTTATREEHNLEAGNLFSFSPDSGGGAITGLRMKVEAEDLPQALRSTVLKISFDGRETVFCPVGEFFGSGVGINSYKSRYMFVENDGTMTSFWIMPFKTECKITVHNYGKRDIKAIIETITDIEWKWTDRTMYFNCRWRQERNIETVAGNGTVDWNYIALKGKGVFVGDSLSVFNRDPAWWGEGDEKIYVEGEKFPSHFGTGTEDYYGYAWCTPAFFESPFHAQPRAEGPNNFGHTTNLRVRLLDGIPFTKDFRFDMEVWHWAQTEIDYAVATYWYGFPETDPVDSPSGKYPTEKKVIEELRAPVSYKNPVPLPKIPGFVFNERPSGGNVQTQDMKNWPNSKWKNAKQLWWTGAKPGDKLELVLESAAAGKKKLEVEMTKAVDYGIVQYRLNGEKIGNPVDLFNDGVVSSGIVTIGEGNVKEGKNVITVEILGKNEKSTNYLFGIDHIDFVE